MSTTLGHRFPGTKLWKTASRTSTESRYITKVRLINEITKKTYSNYSIRLS